MHPYHPTLKPHARRLRTAMTDSEQRLWSRLRRKHIDGVQFYRQKPLGPYIVDFYAPKAKLVIEVDGAQHLEAAHTARDGQRDAYLQGQGLEVLRVNNAQVLQELDAVVEIIARTVQARMAKWRGGLNPP